MIIGRYNGGAEVNNVSGHSEKLTTKNAMFCVVSSGVRKRAFSGSWLGLENE